MKSLRHNTAVCLAYVLFGGLAILLAIPPGISSPIWPSAGVALASLLVYGPAVIPGIWLGSFLVNIFNTIFILHDQASVLASIVLSALLGGNAILESLLGYYLIRRWNNSSLNMIDKRELLRFFFIIVPISCFVGALTAILAQKSMGYIDWDIVPVNFIAWWTGNVIGTSTVTPILLSFLAQPQALWRPRRLGLALPLIFINGLFVLLYFKAFDWYSETIRTSFERRSSYVLHNVKQSFENYELIFNSIEAFWKASEAVTSNEFDLFTNSFFMSFPALQELAWAPYIQAEVKDPYERAYGRMIRSCNKNILSFLPVTYLNSGAEPQIWKAGQDLINGCFRNDITSIPSTWNRVLAENMFLNSARTGKKERCLLVIYPLMHYPEKAPLPGVTESYIFGILNLDRLIEQAFSNHGLEGLELRVYGDSPDQKDRRLIIQRPAGKAAIPPGYTQSMHLEIFRKKYFLLLTLPYTYMAAHPSLETWLLLMLSVFFCLCITCFILISQGETRRVEELVQKRSSELHEQKAKAIHNSKMAGLGLMAAGIAHEINNPLAIIHGFATLLLSKVQSDTISKNKLMEALTKIELTSRRIADIVTALRSYARDEAPQKQTPIHAVNVLMETLNLCQERFREAGITVEILNKDLSEPYVFGHLSFLMQVLLNLLNNAHDAIAALDERWIRITFEKTMDTLSISVMDSGHGIPAAIRERIMQPFFTTKDVGQGTGLGLYVARTLIEKMGGVLELDERETHTTFRIRLLLAQALQKP